MSWSMRLERPIETPEGRKIVTLSDARDYALGLPESRQMAPEVQAGVEALLMVAEGKAPSFMAQSAVAHIVHGPIKPLNRGKTDRPWLKRKSRA